MKIDKTRMVDSEGRPLTQSLFLEIHYDPKAYYSLKEDHHTHETRGFYPSIKKLYIELEDPTEYEFANTYFLNWSHWLRICENKVIRKHVEEWRSELEYKLRCKGVKTMMLAADSGNYQASKWLVDKGWATRPAGRPSKSEIEGEKQFQARVLDEYAADSERLKLVK